MSSDYNFCFPLDLSQLENDRLKLVPFDTNIDLHANLYTSHTTSTPAALVNFDYLPYGPFSTPEDFLNWYNPHIRDQINVVWFAIFVKPKDGAVKHGDEVPDGSRFAGVISYLNADVGMASVELGHLNILPPHQRTFVNTHACGLLLNYALNPPAGVTINAPSLYTPQTPRLVSGPGGLGLRRAQWFANALNAPSRRAAERLGYQYEGTLRWHRILPAHKIDKLGSEDTEKKRPWNDNRGSARDSVVLGLCWDDWLQNGGREHVQKLMARV
ncbi:uncharacterized protein AB675_4321 [Cyphellophora attinorum]|uniref:N-acetyltransferase domain-containing protein n=1 Tax=Cyphellophora attinorum TaxID=1664694 RepID=A0A0N0NJ74_9EURO|nr:uncharacterized protein AB675_4321 [Phialophora attinorum]KPI36588.1 hypothetical protein AB675_4321 [Phialophora attinorum]